jgi:CDP-paratose 2-epimerase
MRFLITGGAGFIGSNTADRLISDGHDVQLLDDLSRRGSEKNLAWLRSKHGELTHLKVDVRDAEALSTAIKRHAPYDVVLHFAAQVAVTSSVIDPREDFEINAFGTLNLLEALRSLPHQPVILYSSTNKVYGALSHLQVVEGDTRYRYEDLPNGVDETTPLDFYSPYGCSKGCADQYFHDYARIYGMNTIVFRNSCIFGTRQFGVEDQGWLAWFMIAAALGKPISIYGNGKQVRDVLFVDDLIEAMLSAIEHIDDTRGQVFNMGGGQANSLSIWAEFEPILSRLRGNELPVSYADWRPGDQPIYISDISKAKRVFGWEPKISTEEGLERLYHWVNDNQTLFEGF